MANEALVVVLSMINMANGALVVVLPMNVNPGMCLEAKDDPNIGSEAESDAVEYLVEYPEVVVDGCLKSSSMLGPWYQWLLSSGKSQEPSSKIYRKIIPEAAEAMEGPGGGPELFAQELCPDPDGERGGDGGLVDDLDGRDDVKVEEVQQGLAARALLPNDVAKPNPGAVGLSKNVDELRGRRGCTVIILLLKSART